jgi:hypothetical protein
LCGKNQAADDRGVAPGPAAAFILVHARSSARIILAAHAAAHTHARTRTHERTHDTHTHTHTRAHARTRTHGPFKFPSPWHQLAYIRSFLSAHHAWRERGPLARYCAPHAAILSALALQLALLALAPRAYRRRRMAAHFALRALRLGMNVYGTLITRDALDFWWGMGRCVGGGGQGCCRGGLGRLWVGLSRPVHAHFLSFEVRACGVVGAPCIGARRKVRRFLVGKQGSLQRPGQQQRVARFMLWQPWDARHSFTHAPLKAAPAPRTPTPRRSPGAPSCSPAAPPRAARSRPRFAACRSPSSS